MRYNSALPVVLVGILVGWIIGQALLLPVLFMSGHVNRYLYDLGEPKRAAQRAEARKTCASPNREDWALICYVGPAGRKQEQN